MFFGHSFNEERQRRSADAPDVGDTTLKNDMFDVIQADLEDLEPALEEAIASETPLITDIGTHIVS